VGGTRVDVDAEGRGLDVVLPDARLLVLAAVVLDAAPMEGRCGLKGLVVRSGGMVGADVGFSFVRCLL
jgi:hypothetical protein